MCGSDRDVLRAVDAHGCRLQRDETQVIAFYLPQYHRIPENSEWWGPGFTEWTNVVRARPNFVGHHQPNIPRDLGFYDLANVEVMREQAELAKSHGISGFCYYYYWFSGRRILEKPLDNFLASDIDIKFCFCWANENWTRTWDGDMKSVLMRQRYADGDAKVLIDTLLPAFRDGRYITVDGRPLLVVYRAKHIPRPREWFRVWREHAVAAGFPGLHISVVDFYDIFSPDEVGADSMVEFPPHKFNGPHNRVISVPEVTNPDFNGGVVDYLKIIAQSALRPVPDFPLFRGIIPGWDNTPRRQNTPTVVANATPDLFGAWLSYIRTYTRWVGRQHSKPLIFINAWNEWGEGCYLEPDIRYGTAYLQEVWRSSFLAKLDVTGDDLEQARRRLLACAEEAGKRFAGNGARSYSFQGYRPPGLLARRVSHHLSRWPLIHRFAARTYGILTRTF